MLNGCINVNDGPATEPTVDIDAAYATFLETIHSLIRPPDIVVGGLMFYHGFFFLLSSFRRLISEFAERNSTKIGHMLDSKVSAI